MNFCLPITAPPKKKIKSGAGCSAASYPAGCSAASSYPRIKVRSTDSPTAYSMACFALAEKFTEETKERSDLNQYWYSPATIEAIVGEIQDLQDASDEQDTTTIGTTSTRCLAVLVSCPSIYFALPKHLQALCVVLDIDTQWNNDPGFHQFDFELDPKEQLPGTFLNNFKMVIIDPPFITEEVWIKYANTAQWLSNGPDCRIICTTIHENATMMQRLLHLHPRKFRPSIPNLVYQYCTFTNFESTRLDTLNFEIDQEDWTLAVAAHQDLNSTDGSKTSHDSDRKIPKQRTENEDDWRQLPILGGESNCGNGNGRNAEMSVRPEVEALLNVRTLLGQIKSSCDYVGKTIQQLARSRKASVELRDTLENLTNLISAVRDCWNDKKIQSLIVDELEGKTAVTAAPPLIELESHNLEVEDFIKFAYQILDSAEATKDQVLESNTRTKKIGVRIFRKQKTLLSLIKKLKKEHREITTCTTKK